MLCAEDMIKTDTFIVPHQSFNKITKKCWVNKKSQKDYLKNCINQEYKVNLNLKKAKNLELKVQN